MYLEIQIGHLELSPRQTRFVASRAFCPTGPGGGIDNSCGRASGTGINWSDDAKERVWQWSDAKTPPPIKPIVEVVKDTPLAIITSGEYSKWIVPSVFEQNESDRMQRAGTMIISHNPSGVAVSAGFWMDHPETDSKADYERYASLTVNERALEELSRQQQWGFGKDFVFHKGRAERNQPGAIVFELAANS